MFEYFKEYTWNLSIGMALDMGANMDEIDRACRELKNGIPEGVDPAIAFFNAFIDVAGQLEKAAREDESNDRHLSASEKYRRAAIMYITGERMPLHTYAPRIAAYDRLLECFKKYIELGGINCKKVEVPYKGSILPALWVRAEGASASQPAPAMVHFNGLDGVKEFLFLSGFPNALARRGVSILVVDNPGVGEALRKHDLHNFAEAEVPAGACVDYLEALPEVDRDRIGMVALSMGGHHAPRATAFEPRFKCCVVWGASYNFAARFRLRVEGRGSEKSVPHLFEHVKWVLGAETIEECVQIADKFTLEGILDRVHVPILVSHGECDRQSPLQAAYSTYEGCVNSPRRELRVHTQAEGGEQHCSIGNMSLATDYMADWVADVFGTVKRKGC